MDVLVDSSVWIAHFRSRNEALVDLLSRDQVLIHPMILGELACGTPPDRVRTLADLSSLRYGQQASLSEALEFVERHQLYGLGCGLVDMFLLASTLMSKATLWTLDKRLGKLAGRFGVLHTTQ
jgi:predicted nucleic acid-binding protein